MDGINYMPWMAKYFSDLVSVGYGINFNNPPKYMRHSGGIREEWFKSNWEKRKLADWKKSQKLLGHHYLATPISWNIDLPLVFRGNNYKIFKIKD